MVLLLRRHLASYFVNSHVNKRSIGEHRSETFGGEKSQEKMSPFAILVRLLEKLVVPNLFTLDATEGESGNAASRLKS